MILSYSDRFNMANPPEIVKIRYLIQKKLNISYFISQRYTFLIYIYIICNLKKIEANLLCCFLFPSLNIRSFSARKFLVYVHFKSRFLLWYFLIRNISPAFRLNHAIKPSHFFPSHKNNSNSAIF